MTVPKVFKTIEDQIKILRSRGLRVDSRHKTILLHENYYNIINGYKKPFLASCGPNETYLRGTSFKEIIALYEFDRSLRYITLRRLLKMETHIKSVVAYVFSKYHGYDHKLYLDATNFDIKNRTIKAIGKLISTCQDIIIQKNTKHDAITHYLSKSNYVPLWVLTGVLTMGNISRFYSLMKKNERDEVAQILNTREDHLRNYLVLFTDFRNVCAHSDRLYNLFFTKKKIPAIPLTFQAVSVDGKPFSCSYNYNFFTFLLCMKLLSPNTGKDSFASLKKEIEKELNRLSRQLHTVTIESILTSMGFPKNWSSI